MAELLVTGGAGFIGTNFVRSRRKTHPGDGITVLDALTYAGNRGNIADLDDVSLIHGDIRDTELVLQILLERGIDAIVHLAAETHVDRSIQGPAAFIAANVVGTHSLLEAARAAWLDRGTGRPHRFHHISTDEVYGSLADADPPSNEESPCAPNSPYAASKAASDHLVRAYHRTYGLQATTIRCSNNYGPYQYPEKLVPLFAIHCLTGRPLPIYGDGLNVRDWIHVEDHVRAIGQVLDRGRPGEVYNVASGEELPNLALVDLLCAAVDAAFAEDRGLARRFPDAPAARGEASAILKSFVADRPGHDRRYAIDTRKIRRELGFEPSRRLAEELGQTVRWYLDNEGWWSWLRQPDDGQPPR